LQGLNGKVWHGARPVFWFCGAGPPVADNPQIHYCATNTPAETLMLAD